MSELKVEFISYNPDLATLPNIAVLITYYNERAMLTECLESVLGQLGAGDEVLVYDDCSTYPPGPYIPNDAQVKVIRGGSNVGPGVGRNVLLGAATAEYVHFHDSDDLFAPSWAATVKKSLVAADIDWLLSEVASFDDGGCVSDRVMGVADLVRGNDPVAFAIAGGLLVPSGVYRKSVVQAIGGYREELWQSEDYDFHIRLAAAGLRLKIVPEPLVRIRLRLGSRSGCRSEVLESALQAIELLSHELPDEYRRHLCDAAARMAHSAYIHGHSGIARKGFALGAKLGTPSFQEMPLAYRLMARSLGPVGAEAAAAAYRRCLPESLRRAVRAQWQ